MLEKIKKVIMIIVIIPGFIFLMVNDIFGEKVCKIFFFCAYVVSLALAIMSILTLLDYGSKNSLPPWSLLGCMLATALVAMEMEFFRKTFFTKLIKRREKLN